MTGSLDRGIDRHRHRRCRDLRRNRNDAFITDVETLDQARHVRGSWCWTRRHFRHEVILHTLHGLGGTVLKTNVDLERAKLIQTTLSGGLVHSDALDETANSNHAPSAPDP